MKYNNWTLGQVEAVFNKLGGDDGVRRFLAGKLVVKPVDRNWSTWKTIRLGTGLKSVDDFRKAIKDCGMRIGDWANDILGKPEFTVTTEETEVDLVNVTVAELGFKDGTRRDQIYGRAKELGLELCPPEVGPQLRLQYKDQPKGEWILIGIEPICNSDGSLFVFDIVHNDNGIWLYSTYVDPGCVWRATSHWVFICPRKCLDSWSLGSR